MVLTIDYSKERLKMGALLVLGFVLAISFFSLQSSLNIGGRNSDSFSSGFIFVAIVCYPLAIIYGLHQIMDVFNSISFGDRQPFRITRTGVGSESLISVLNFIFATVMIIFFGWIYGTYNAYKKLQFLKIYR